MRALPWLVVVLVLAGLGWAFGTPYVNSGPTLCGGNQPAGAQAAQCLPPLVCGYVGLQGSMRLSGPDSCPAVRLVKWDSNRNLFGWRQSGEPAQCDGPAGPVDANKPGKSC
jgi:hypothetical protein